MSDDVVRVAIRRRPECGDLPYPARATPGSSGFDLLAAVERPMHLERGRVALIPTGIAVAVPPGYEAQVRARSGLALKHGLTLVNAPGTIDADYRGEIGVIVTLLGESSLQIERGMRIAQLVFAPVARVELCPVEELPPTSRGDGGFGHTGW